MKHKLYAIFLCIITPGVLLSWVLIMFPFYIYDSLKNDWIYDFKSDVVPFFKGIKEIWSKK